MNIKTLKLIDGLLEENEAAALKKCMKEADELEACRKEHQWRAGYRRYRMDGAAGYDEDGRNTQYRAVRSELCGQSDAGGGVKWRGKVMTTYHCSKEAYFRCPNRQYCGTQEEAFQEFAAQQSLFANE